MTTLPGVTAETLSVFVIARSASARTVSVSVAELLDRFGSELLGRETEAVLERVPLADGLNVAVAANVAVPPTARLTVWLMWPEPLADPQADPTEAEHVQLTETSAAGKVSVRTAFVTRMGPSVRDTDRVGDGLSRRDGGDAVRLGHGDVGARADTPVGHGHPGVVQAEGVVRGRRSPG